MFCSLGIPLLCFCYVEVLDGDSGGNVNILRAVVSAIVRKKEKFHTNMGIILNG